MSRAVRITGTLLALAFIGVLVVRQAPHLPRLDLTSPALWVGVVATLLFYILSQFAAAEAWRKLMQLFGVTLPPGLIRGQHLVSMIGKYVPGNVAHLIGRMALGRRDGIAAGTLGAGMLLEFGITLGVGIGVVGLLVLLRPDMLSTLSADYPILANPLLPFAIAGLISVGIGAGVWLLRRRLHTMGVERPSVGALTFPVAIQGLNFAILGLSLWATALAIDAEAAPGPLVCVLIFALAWTTGFVTPGAPSGMGVRDGIVTLALALTMGEGTALAVALLHRGTSMLGDLMTFSLGLLLRRGHAAQGPRKEPKHATFVTD